MKSYEYTRIISPYFSNFQVLSTDPNIIKWVLEELKKIVPSYHHIEFEEAKDISGNLVGISIDKLSGKDSELEIWLMQELCHHGWEPFAITGANGSVRYIHLRLEKTGE